jgi:hypothetical protein
MRNTEDTTVLRVPSLHDVVVGVVAYHGVHQYFLEAGDGAISARQSAIDALHSGAVRRVELQPKSP